MRKKILFAAVREFSKLKNQGRKRENIVSFRIRKLRKNMMVPIGVILRQWKPARIPALGLVFNGVATWAAEGAIPIPFTSLLGFAIDG